MSFSLEFYSLSWEVLKKALNERPADLIAAIKSGQWGSLLHDDDLGPHPTMLDKLFHHRAPDDPSRDVDALFNAALDEIGQAMTRPTTADRDPPSISDHAALVFAGFVRQLGKPVGALSYDGTIVHDNLLQLKFRGEFLSGVVGSCFDTPRLGEKLAARPLFGLFHLDFVAWGGLLQKEIGDLLPRYKLTAEQQRGAEWQAVEDHAQSWLDTVIQSLRRAADAKSDLVTLYLTVQHEFGSFYEGTRESFDDDMLSRDRRRGLV